MITLTDEAAAKIADCLERCDASLRDCIFMEKSPAAWDAIAPEDAPPMLADKGPTWQGLPGTHGLLPFIHEARQLLKQGEG